MREIKFRAWNNSHNTMEYDIQNDYDCILSCFGGFLNNEFWEVMQYTGLKDKNNKEIYEGDIVNIEIKDKTIKNKIIATSNEVVEYKDCKFGVVWGWHRDFICLDGFYNTDFKIKGNIYENPELLEG
ncbi:hypothetical protein EXM99_08180 [Clostridium botulinum]|nr:hypothetical protein [Clostridium botulinum]